jgi:hypothetical protein
MCADAVDGLFEDPTPAQWRVPDVFGRLDTCRPQRTFANFVVGQAALLVLEATSAMTRLIPTNLHLSTLSE